MSVVFQRGVAAVGALLVVTLVIAVPPAAAQDGRSIFSLVDPAGKSVGVGLTVRGTITEGDLMSGAGDRLQVWRLEVEPGTYVRVDLRSDAFDPYLQVFGPSLVPGLSDDDSGVLRDARLCFSVPDADTRLVVSSLYGSLGEYTLEVASSDPDSDAMCAGDSDSGSSDPAQFPTDDRRLAPGESVEGTLSDADLLLYGAPARAWALEAVAGQTLTIDLRSTEFDPYLIVAGADLNLDDDDGGGGCNSRLTVTFPSDGLYRLIATPIGSGRGLFTLSASSEPGPVDPGTCSSAGFNAPPLPDIGEFEPVGAVAVGSAADGTLPAGERLYNGSPMQAWTLAGLRGQRLAVNVLSDAFDALVYFGGPGFSEPLSNDDGGEGVNALLCVELPRDGEYRILAGGLSEGAEGAYRLVVDRDVPDDVCYYYESSPEALRDALLELPHADRVIRVGDERDGLLSDGDTPVTIAGVPTLLQAWRLEAEPGSTVWIDLVSEAFDPLLRVASGTEESVRESDDYPDGGWNSRVDIVVPDAGWVAVLVGPYDPSARGAFRLRASIEPPPLETNRASGDTGGSAPNRAPAAMFDGIAVDESRTLEIGLEVEVRLTEADPVLENGHRVQAWRFEAAAGDRFIVQLLSSDLDPSSVDPIVYLAGPGIGEPFVDDDGGPSLDSRLDVTAPEAGTFTIYAGGLDGAVGTVYLQIVRRR